MSRGIGDFYESCALMHNSSRSLGDGRGTGRTVVVEGEHGSTPNQRKYWINEWEPENESSLAVAR